MFAPTKLWCSGLHNTAKTYVAPIALKDYIPEVISSTRKSVETVPKQCRTSVSQGPTCENPRVW
eukprot:4011742-Pyramimonas_sp.AAC.1